MKKQCRLNLQRVIEVADAPPASAEKLETLGVSFVLAD